MAGKILGLDYGEKNIGIAISDNDQIIALNRGILKSEPEETCLKEIITLCQQENIASLVFGLPLNLQGEEAYQAQKTRLFADKLAGEIGLPVYFIDERFTTNIIKSLRKQEKTKKQRQEKKYDSQSAVLILQGYLDQKRLNIWQLTSDIWQPKPT